MKFKFCGFKNSKDIDNLFLLKNFHNIISYIGFIFCASSKRNISQLDAYNIFTKYKDLFNKYNINIVAVFKDADLVFIDNILKSTPFSFIQLHGKEDINYIEQIKNNYSHIKIIKAISINNKSDLKLIDKYNNYVNYFLLDNKLPGSGKKFDWNIINNFKFKDNIFLSGGIDINDLPYIRDKLKSVKMIDMASNIEDEDGDKSIDRMQKIIDMVNQAK